jgi:hypothetical protein
MFDYYLHHGSFEAFYKVGRTIPLGLFNATSKILTSQKTHIAFLPYSD